MHKVHIHLEYFEQQLVVWVYLQPFERLVWVSDGFSVSAEDLACVRPQYWQSVYMCVSVDAGLQQTWGSYRASFARGLTCTGEMAQTLYVSMYIFCHVQVPKMIKVLSRGEKNSVEYMHYLDTFRALILYICYSPLPTSVLTLLYLKVALYICLRSGRPRGRRQTASSTVRWCNMNLPIKGP